MKRVLLCKTCLVEPIVSQVETKEGEFLIDDLTWTCPVCRKKLSFIDVTQMPKAEYRKLDRERYMEAMQKAEVARG